MLLYCVGITAAMLASGPDDAAVDIFARLGVPRLETCNFRIHVGENGVWKNHQTQIYSVKGVSADVLSDFEEMLMNDSRKFGAQYFRRSGVGVNRRQCVSKGKSEDAIRLASLLGHVFEVDKCEYFHWDGDTFEWRILPNSNYATLRDGNSVTEEPSTDLLFGSRLLAAVGDEIREEVGKEGFESLMQELATVRLLITTDGRINADFPAELSEDGKSMTLELSKFLSNPPKKWSIRFSGL